MTYKEVAFERDYRGYYTAIVPTRDRVRGEDPDNWIINEICRTFNVKEVKE